MSKATFTDSPVSKPEKGTGTLGIVLLVEILTLVTFKGITFVVASSAPLYPAPNFKYT